MVADCIPILIYDPIQEVIAAVQAGRSGVFKNILSETINTECFLS
ncbi:laccase domain-containing protein [Sulfurimonas sp. MAG313]|nr:laccase domain-containing protein [Sulfurimonas sp. MAG313]